MSVLMTSLLPENQMKSIWENLHRVLPRYRTAVLSLTLIIFVFMLDKVEYLQVGTTISAAGISPTAEKVQAIKDAAPPTNVSELQSFLGSANFLRLPYFA